MAVGMTGPVTSMPQTIQTITTMASLLSECAFHESPPKQTSMERWAADNRQLTHMQTSIYYDWWMRAACINESTYVSTSMPFILPSFPIVCNIFTNGVAPPAAPRLSDAPCNLAWGKRTAVPSTGGTNVLGVPLFTMTLLLEKETDVRGRLAAGGSDTVEVPAGSGRIYECVYVDDIGKGFANEHRAVICLATVQPTPLP